MNIVRDNFPPEFLNTPYDRAVLLTAGAGDVIVTALADDPDLHVQVCCQNKYILSYFLLSQKMYIISVISLGRLSKTIFRRRPAAETFVDN